MSLGRGGSSPLSRTTLKNNDLRQKPWVVLSFLATAATGIVPLMKRAINAPASDRLVPTRLLSRSSNACSFTIGGFESRWEQPARQARSGGELLSKERHLILDTASRHDKCDLPSTSEQKHWQRIRVQSSPF